MRLQYFRPDGTDDAVSLIPRTQSGQWHHLTFRLNIETGQLTAVAESGGTIVTAITVTVNPVGTPIVSLNMTGFDRNSAVYFDNLTGVLIR